MVLLFDGHHHAIKYTGRGGLHMKGCGAVYHWGLDGRWEGILLGKGVH